jgi:hypothetical protein
MCEPRPELQRALDTMLARASDEQRTRFFHAARRPVSPTGSSLEPGLLGRPREPAADRGRGLAVEVLGPTYAEVARPRRLTEVVDHSPDPEGTGLPRRADRRVPDAGEVLSGMDEDVAAFGTWAEQLSVGSVAIERLHQRTRRIAQEALTRPPGELLVDAVALGREVFHLSRTHHKPAHSRDLYAIVAQLCALTAWIAGDIGLLDKADLYGRTASACAALADEAHTTAWVLVVQSKTAFWRRDYDLAVSLARKGLQAEPPGTSGLMLACQVADVLSQLGARERTASALGQADRLAQAERGTDLVGGLFSCGPARHANYVAGTYLAIDQTTRALKVTDSVLRKPQDDPSYGFGTIAQLQVTEFLTHAATGDLEAAAQAGRPVLDLPPDRRLATLTSRIQRLDGILAGRPLRARALARQLREEVSAYCRPVREDQ